ncbi:hypothetical protein CLAFUW4_08713 [Fulvia fulva]|uniref:uncharacterized protein n=1 Tax=Passalora fulva TaxID=5499 RepID=UPI002852509A|nr:uncharacterized protein CLAFUR5_20268 [Fulvia fulva]KAK4614202.1 hypothetical protein CLAFUR4_08718 [Fulvia fulva]KAK4614690.1 hypothetical protein CLAFUR0_08714 [Fulvia fulva]WMI38993.1 hypothetical protein CLAFUR5_20268 [Fulvia fulva]WPV20234.1 hypothetical protein CLAFUW4_08713 [Fulvia fulva]WPV35615.1 hypothetical protein CLAFUW7_08713 [Fulvia fulva]
MSADVFSTESAVHGTHALIKRCEKLHRALFFLPVKGGALDNHWRLDLCTTHLWSYPGGTIPMQVFSNPLLAPLYRSMKTESSVFSS